MSVQANGGYDIEQRMADIAGQPQRIPPLGPDQLGPEAHDLAVKTRAAMGIPEDGAMPEVMATMLVHPELFKVQMDLGLVLATGTIPARERELAVLRIGWLCGAPYEWGEHVVISKRLGVTDEEVERTTIGSAAEGWGDHDRAILKGVEELIGNQFISDATWATLAATWSDKQLMEFPMVVGAYVTTAFQQNSLRMRLAPNNPGLSLR